MLEPYLPGFSPIGTPATTTTSSKTADANEDEGVDATRKNPFAKREEAEESNPFASKKETVKSAESNASNPFNKSEKVIKNKAVQELKFSTPKRGNDVATVFAPELPASLTPRMSPLTPRLSPQSDWEKSGKCKVCSLKFTPVRRRHHCRKCGSSTCDKCSRCRLFVPDVGEIRICLKCSETMLVNDQELEQVRSDLSKLVKEFAGLKELHDREKRLNSEYSEDVNRLKTELSEQKRRSSIQRQEMSKMSCAVATLTEKIERFAQDQDKIRNDHSRAMEQQRANYDKELTQIKRIQKERVWIDAQNASKTNVRDIDSNAFNSNTRKSSTSSDSEITRGSPKRVVRNASSTTDQACACVVM